MNIKCPLCRTDTAHKTPLPGMIGFSYNCDVCDEFILLKCLDEIIYQDRKISNSIYNFLLKSPQNKNERLYQFYYDKENKVSKDIFIINVLSLLRDYPQTTLEKLEKVLINLSIIYPKIGEYFSSAELNCALLYCESDDYDYEKESILSMLTYMMYIKITEDPRLTRIGYQPDCYTIHLDGWKRIDELNKKHKEINQGFCAMSFKKETQNISDSFEKAINFCGYNFRRIDQKEHNNQIVPEIFYEINRSKFIVVDVTIPNNGAYYEAGYAQALGKQVIVCCNEIIFNSKDTTPHFDISQKNMIIWKDEKELEEKLIKRIESTVGRNVL